jgi:hypothetical protein
MAQRFKAKTLISNSGVFNNEVIAPNLVYNTGNQTIAGLKTFSNGVVSSVGITGANLVYNTGNQNISGVKTFLNNFIVSGTGSIFPILQITGVNDVLINGNNSFGIYQQSATGTLTSSDYAYPNNLTRALNSPIFYSGIVSGTNFTSGLKPGNLLYYTTKSDAIHSNAAIDKTRVRIKARPYMVVDNVTGYNNSYQPNFDSGGNRGNFSFLKFNNNSQYSGLGIKQLIFNPTIQNAYRSYDLVSGIQILVKPQNIHLETFIDINVKSGNYWSLKNFGVDRYLNETRDSIIITQPKSFNFTQAHVLNFKFNFERDDRVTTIEEYPNRVVRIFSAAPFIHYITGYDFEFSQKLRLILNTDGTLKEW